MSEPVIEDYSPVEIDSIGPPDEVPTEQEVTFEESEIIEPDAANALDDAQDERP